MLRTAFAVLACFLSAACSGWVSDERLFGDGDWAHLDINGRYQNDNNESAERGIVRTLPNGLIEMRSSDKRNKDVMIIGLVPIKGGSGDFFLSVDRSDASKKGDQYFIVNVPDGRTLQFYIPNCDATPEMPGMTKVRDDRWLVKSDETAAVDAPATEEPAAPQEAANAQADESADSKVCKFATKDALMTAGLEAEKFLSTKHIIALTPFMSVSPDNQPDKPAAKKRPTRRPPPRPSRR